MDKLEEIKGKIKDSLGPLSGGFVEGTRPANDEYSDDWLRSFGRYKGWLAATEMVNGFTTIQELEEWLTSLQSVQKLRRKQLTRIPKPVSVSGSFDWKIFEGSTDFLDDLIELLVPLGSGEVTNG